MFAVWNCSHDEPQYCQRGILMSGSVCVEDTKTFIAYVDAINLNIEAYTCIFDFSLPRRPCVSLFTAHCKE